MTREHDEQRPSSEETVHCPQQPGRPAVEPFAETQGQGDSAGAAQDTLSPGSRLGTGGRYQLVRLIGRGGYGAVYEGHDSQLDRRVAVKVPGRNMKAERLEEFVSEARRLAKLHHPGIVAVYDVGRTEKHVFIVTEYLDGESLDYLLQRGQLDDARMIGWVIQIAEALAHAHAQGIVHRDIKPGNIIITRDDRPVLFDFGLAITDDESTGPEKVIVGTPAYMSPEQAQAQAHRVDGRTDVFSLGTVLYQMLAGRPPFRAKSLRELRRRIIEDQPQPLRQLFPSISPSLEAVCLKAMSKRIEDRYTTAGDFAHALETAASGMVHAPDTTIDEAETSSAATDSDSSPRRHREGMLRRVTLAVANFEPILASGESFSQDPEEQLDYSRQFLSICHECGPPFGGTIVPIGGQAVVMCFGFPIAYEDAAERAVRYGLSVLEMVDGVKPGKRSRKIDGLTAWVAIHSGEAVVEDAGKGSPDAFSLSGEAVNVAARLEEVVEPGRVAISQATRELVAGYFRTETVGQQTLRGVAETITMHIVKGAEAVQNRVELIDAENLTPLVGRNTELGILKERWEHAIEGLGQVVLLIGDAGLGKSRLVRELKEHLLAADGDAAPRIVEFRCSAYHRNTGFFPAIEYFERVLDFEECTSSNQRLARIAKHLRQVGLTGDANVSLLAALLNLPVEQRALSPQKQRERTQELLIEWLRAFSRDEPTLFVVEDLHWSDPSTLEWLTRVVEQYKQDRVLTLLTFRPEFQTPWRSHAHQTQIALNRLTRRQIGEMMVKRAKVKEIPDRVLAQIAERTDGVPLFIEEFTDVVEEAGILEQANPGGESLGVIQEIPASLQDLLVARLDRMASNQEVVQLAATIGREFSFHLLAAASELDDHALQIELDKLVKAELLYQEGTPPACVYVFKHALIQDAAYNSLLNKTRRGFHRRIAEVVEQQLQDVASSQPELLAHHLTEAGEAERAIHYWLKAGQQAQASSSVLEAIGHFQQGLTLVQTLPESVERDRIELEFQLPLGNVIIQAKGYAAGEVATAFQRAHDLCQRIGEGAPLFHVSVGMSKFVLVNGDLTECRRWTDKLLRLAESQDDAGIVMEAYFSACCTLFYAGELAKSVEYGEKGGTLYDEERCRFHARFTGQNAGVGIPAYGSLSMWALGYPERAMSWSRQGVALAEELDDPFSHAFGLYHLGWLEYYCGNGEVLKQCGDQGLAIATELSFVLFEALAVVNQGAALLCNDDGEHLAEGVQLVRKGLSAYLGTGAKVHVAHPYTILTRGLLKAGKLDDAQTELDNAFEHSRRSAEHFVLAEMQRLQGEILMARGEHQYGKAERCLLQAAETAARQEAKSWTLRTAVSLARLWERQGRRQEARNGLRKAFDAFDEGYDTRDLIQAKSLLSELS